MLCQRLLPGCERRLRWRHLCLRHNLTIEHGSRRRLHLVRRIGVNSKHAVVRWRYCRSCSQASRSNFSHVHGHRRSRNRLRAGKRSLRHGYYRARNISVHVPYVVDGRVVVDDCRVVDIGDRRSVDVGVADVDAVDVSATYSIRRHIHFSRAQGKPTHIAAKTPAYPHEDDEGGGVNRPDFHRTRYPAPASSDRTPASIVKWSVSPGLVIDPGPSPRTDPGPMALAVGGPSCGNARKPNVAIAGLRAPVAVFIQVLVPDDIMRNVARGLRVFVAPVATLAPVVEVVGTTEILHLGVEPVCTLHRRALPGVHRIGLPVAG